MSQLTAREIAAAFEKIAPIETGNPHDELGFVFGDADSQVTGVACMWKADASSIARAVRQGLNMLIVHEGLFMKASASPWYTAPRLEAEILPNRLRRELLEKHGMVVYRSHSNWDALPKDGVVDQAIAALGIDGVSVHAVGKYVKVLELPDPISVAALAERAKVGLGMPWVLVFGDDQRQVTRFAFLVGGFGGNQPHMPQRAIEMGAEALIFGEMSELIVIAASECGAPVIVTLHSASEIPALKRQAEMLRDRFPGLKVEHIDSGALAFGGTCL